MQRRILLLVMVCILVVLAGIGIVSHLSVKTSIDNALHAHLMSAEIISNNIDKIIERNIIRLHEISESGSIDLNDGNWDSERRTLRSAYEHSLFTDGLFLTDLDGNILYTYPPKKEGTVNLSGLPYMSEALRNNRPVISNLYTINPGNRKIIFVLVPLKDLSGQTIGIVGGEMNPTNYFFSSIVESMSFDDTTCIEIVDSLGTVIASNLPERFLVYSDHNKFFAKAISQQQSFVGECHRCHLGQADARQPETDVLALSPLKNAPWAVTVREPKSLIYAPSSGLQKSFLLVSLLVLCASVVLSIGLSKSIVEPLKVLTEASEKMAEGILSESITVKRHDEIGKLAQSFDVMRQRLDESLKRIQNSNSELEQKILERTHELRVRKRQLDSLLQVGMKHQEEERKRIARELHDETSQALAAVGMSLEVAVMALNQKELTPEMLTEIHAKVSGLVDGINRIIHNLRPPVLDDLGLEAAITWLFERQLPSKGIRYSLDTGGLTQVTLDNKNELRLFRIVQEAVTNIIRHSQAQYVCFSARRHPGKLTVSITDTGVGFDVDNGMNSLGLEGSLEGYGLLGMRERVLHMSGDLEIHSYPNEGTIVSISIPATTMEEAYVEGSHVNSR